VRKHHACVKQAQRTRALAPGPTIFQPVFKTAIFFDAIGDYPKRQQLKYKANGQKQRAKSKGPILLLLIYALEAGFPGHVFQ
jgi:hypothetical protein